MNQTIILCTAVARYAVVLSLEQHSRTPPICKPDVRFNTWRPDKLVPPLPRLEPRLLGQRGTVMPWEQGLLEGISCRPSAFPKVGGLQGLWAKAAPGIQKLLGFKLVYAANLTVPHTFVWAPFASTDSSKGAKLQFASNGLH